MPGRGLGEFRDYMWLTTGGVEIVLLGYLSFESEVKNHDLQLTFATTRQHRRLVN